MNTKEYKTDFNGRPLVAEFSDITEQANGSVTIKYGETVVMATAVMSEHQREGLQYFPLSVDYEEKFYAAGKILGGRFMRREGRPSEEAVLNSRMIDRTIRPLFDKRIRNDIQVVAIPMSLDEENDPDILAILASSLALAVSDIPWNGPVGAVRIGRVNSEFIINPDYQQKEQSDLEMVICGKDGKINMIEGKAKQIPEDIILESFKHALPEIKKLIDFQNKIVNEIGKEKIWPEIKETPGDLELIFEKHIKPQLEVALEEPVVKQEERKKHYFVLGDIQDQWVSKTEEKFGSEHVDTAKIFFEDAIDQIIHKNILEKEKRPDGRKLDQVREISTKISLFPRTHGSGLFYRGLTHILSVITLGAPGDVLLIEGMEVSEKRRFLHHYNFPPFSVGETGRLGGPGRREIGHGSLASKALEAIIPLADEFPHTIRIVSETMSSNGSSSMGSVCASTLALMDAGVPIKMPVSGIAMGIMIDSKKEKNNYKVLTDIQGPEDHHGDADFKTAGTENGVTAIQMDVKVDGLTVEMLNDILIAGKKARMEILKQMLQTIPETRSNLSPYAPQIITLKINPEKIREVVGPGGKVINKIIETTGAQIDIEQDGTVFITGKDEESAKKAKDFIDDIVYVPEIGEKMEGAVTRIFDFGAMVEIKSGTEGLIHISELAPFRVNKVTDVLKPGDIVPVKVIKIDEKGRINLSLKQADPSYAKKASEDKPDYAKRKQNPKQ